MSQPIAVIGAGAWGTALAVTWAAAGRPVTLWAHDPATAAACAAARANDAYLPGVPFPASLTVTADMAEAVADARQVVFVVPSKFMRSPLVRLGEVVSPDATVTLATKGIENDTLAFPVDVARQTLPPAVAGRLCALSGPTFAREVVTDVPSAATIASLDVDAALTAQRAFSTDTFRLYVHHDLLGVELAGAVKNVIAIAAGVADGLGFGHNTRAALITRGLSEIARLGSAMGADERTFTGLAGMGDLVLTCTGDLSRNRTVGLRLGRGEKLAAILASTAAVAEGVSTATALRRLADREGVDMPIAEQVYKIVHEGADPKQSVARLMGRSLKQEFY
jgi:glycerol-3-phosphate dehydrogenase (NAD(P)+)